jgi:8-oxo-dGTP pyrophosphatase MutT (NUDIX family)
LTHADGTNAGAVDRPRLLALRGRLLARAQMPTPEDSIPVLMAGVQVGLTAPRIAGFLAAQVPRFTLNANRLTLDDADLDCRARTAILTEAALRLRAAGLVRGWRDEALDVRALPSLTPGAVSPQDMTLPPLATIERAVCRTLGINTTAVHINAVGADGGLWVARRSLSKPIDPGLWDNLTGGMVAAGESEFDAIRREAWEEAGIDLHPATVTAGHRLQIARPVPEGFMAQTIQIFDTTLPADAQPRNQDGEVAAIELRPIAAVIDAIERGEFTLEAALVTVDSLLGRVGHGLD